MSVVEDVRKVLQDFLAPALREIRGQLAAMKEIHRIRHDYLGAAPRTIQQSFAFEKRISDLEA